MKNPLSFQLWLCILLSVACLQTLYSQRPRGISQDVTFSLFAAQNAVDHGRFQSIDHVIDSDLGKIKLQWLTLWPPLVSLGYAVLLKGGLSPGAATNLMVLVLVFSGTLGWVLLFQRAGVNRVALHVLALAIPWMSFPAWAWTFFLNDHVAWSLVPWGFFLLLGLPDTNAVTARDFWWRLPLAALVCGLVVVAKYSAFPLVMGAGIYFLARDGWFCNGKKIMHGLWFGAFLIMPGMIVYLVNHALSGHATAQVGPGPTFFAIGVRQIWNILVPPLMDISGWSDIDQRTGTANWKHYLLAGMVILIWLGIGLAISRRRQIQMDSRMLKLLLIMTAATWMFFIIITTAFGHYDWTTQARLSFPVIFAWFCLAITLVFDRREQFIPRVWLALVCGIPLVASVVVSAGRPFLGVTPESMPQCRLAAPRAQCAAYGFLEYQLANGEVRPNLIISGGPEPMNELKIPTVWWNLLERFQDLHSSKPLVVWALLDQASSQVLRSHLDKSAIVRQVQMPKDSPWELLVLDFK
jgi:hypothetical protein